MLFEEACLGVVSKRTLGDMLKAGDRLEEIEGVHDPVGCDVRTLGPGTVVHFSGRLLLIDSTFGAPYSMTRAAENPFLTLGTLLATCCIRSTLALLNMLVAAILG